MGVWGSGLYSGDFARDLHCTIGALCRLPLEGARILSILRDQEPASNDARNEQYTTFWLIVADQFQKRGVDCAEAAKAAVAIIDGGLDSATQIRLGMKPADIRKREIQLSQLKSRLLNGSAKRTRHTIKQPERFIMEMGDVYVYPTSRSRPINPYAKSKERVRKPPYNWQHDGWSAMVVLNRGRAFEYLVWYALVVLDAAYRDKPTLEQLMNHSAWVVTPPGTCSAQHFRHMELELISRLAINPETAARFYPSPRSSTRAAASDISIANHMKAARVMTSRGPSPLLERLAELTAG